MGRATGKEVISWTCSKGFHRVRFVDQLMVMKTLRVQDDHAVRGFADRQGLDPPGQRQSPHQIARWHFKTGQHVAVGHQFENILFILTELGPGAVDAVFALYVTLRAA